VANLALGSLCIPVFIRAANIVPSILYPIVLVLSMGGVYSYGSNLTDVRVMLFFGVLGYLMRRYGFPMAPLAVAFILGTLTEVKLRQGLIIANGDLTEFVTRPISAFFLTLFVLALAWVARQQIIQRAERKKSSA
jgi:putative tricarboxylic transport membrane protein